jgi:hypothetical protein
VRTQESYVRTNSGAPHPLFNGENHSVSAFVLFSLPFLLRASIDDVVTRQGNVLPRSHGCTSLV